MQIRSVDNYYPELGDRFRSYNAGNMGKAIQITEKTMGAGSPIPIACYVQMASISSFFRWAEQFSLFTMSITASAWALTNAVPTRLCLRTYVPQCSTTYSFFHKDTFLFRLICVWLSHYAASPPVYGKRLQVTLGHRSASSWLFPGFHRYTGTPSDSPERHSGGSSGA